tara:strand:+ start:3687 stop:4148 length:462 start_codon:yes stop_codon:yes gene_type:complete
MPRISIEDVYMEVAYSISKLSYANRRQVGCVIVKDNQMISFGYNGTPHGFDNSCEDIVTSCNNDCGCGGCDKTSTKREVLHAESNALSKIAKSTMSSDGAYLYTTTSPCFECAKLIIQSGIKEVYYNETYRDMGGIELLEKANINVIQTNVSY